MLFRLEPPDRTPHGVRALVVRPRRLVGVTVAVASLLVVGACGSQKALTPPATPPAVAVPTTGQSGEPEPMDTEASGLKVWNPVRPSTTTTTATPTPTKAAASPTAKPTPSSSTTTKKPAPKASATPTPTKTATPAPAPAPKAPAAGAPVSGCGNPNPGKVLLTFDDGGPQAPSILAILDRYGIKARWFPTGQWASGNTAFMARLVADGQMTGNHTYSHPQMLASLGTAELTRQIKLGYHPTNVFRFPYGASDATSRALVKSMGYSICGWSIDTLDWKGTSTDTIANTVISQARPGAVVLMHQSFATDVQALPRIIENLRSRGLI